MADLTIFKSNPNCSCRGRVTKFFSDKLQQDPTLLNKYIYNEAELIEQLNQVEISRQQIENYTKPIVSNILSAFMGFFINLYFVRKNIIPLKD